MLSPRVRPVNAPAINETREQIGQIDKEIINKFGQIRQNCSVKSEQELEDTIFKFARRWRRPNRPLSLTFIVKKYIKLPGYLSHEEFKVKAQY